MKKNGESDFKELQNTKGSGTTSLGGTVVTFEPKSINTNQKTENPPLDVVPITSDEAPLSINQQEAKYPASTFIPTPKSNTPPTKTQVDANSMENVTTKGENETDNIPAIVDSAPSDEDTSMEEN